MYYNKFKDIELSALGFGCMRLPVVDGDDTRPDEAAVQEMTDCAMANGVNYYDTAWGYHGGNSETVIGKALSKYDRDSFYLASKFPGYDLSSFDRIEEIFECYKEA
jgi:predicted aldo/keto reductase-like oxidoreductase